MEPQKGCSSRCKPQESEKCPQVHTGVNKQLEERKGQKGDLFLPKEGGEKHPGGCWAGPPTGVETGGANLRSTGPLCRP